MAEPSSGKKPAGTLYGALSLKPLTEAKAFLTHTMEYTTERRAAAGGCPVFHAHPGVKSALVTDHAGMEAVFEAPPHILDRETEPGFGCLALRTGELLDGVVPALVTHEVNHAGPRGLVDRVMATRESAFKEVCNRVLERGWPSLAGADRTCFDAAVVHTSVHLTFGWFFGMEGPPGAEHQAWLKACFGLKTDTWLTNVLAGLAAPKPKADVRAYSQTWLAKIRASAPYASYVAIGAELGLPEADIAPHLLFAAGFNGGGGTYTTAFPALGVLHHDPALRKEIADELAGFKGDVDALDALPLLDAFLHETMRKFGRPRQYYRRVLRDTTIPTSSGESVELDAGTRLGLVAVAARQDPTVFADPERFDPHRLLRDPALKAKVYAFGPAGAHGTYGCAGGANGTAPRLWKVVVASLARTTDWRLDPAPVPNIDAPTGLDPDTTTWMRA